MAGVPVWSVKLGSLSRRRRHSIDGSVGSAVACKFRGDSIRTQSLGSSQVEHWPSNPIQIEPENKWITDSYCFDFDDGLIHNGRRSLHAPPDTRAQTRAEPSTMADLGVWESISVRVFTRVEQVISTTQHLEDNEVLGDEVDVLFRVKEPEESSVCAGLHRQPSIRLGRTTKLRRPPRSYIHIELHIETPPPSRPFSWFPARRCMPRFRLREGCGARSSGVKVCGCFGRHLERGPDGEDAGEVEPRIGSGIPISTRVILPESNAPATSVTKVNERPLQVGVQVCDEREVLDLAVVRNYKYHHSAVFSKKAASTSVLSQCAWEAHSIAFFTNPNNPRSERRVSRREGTSLMRRGRWRLGSRCSRLRSYIEI
ncbi:hypothetical protein C8R46DRAFT_1088064 [Mycena filopes]|nr:hypothetical protein C8R46DRAFT_1088064 [Mycena filopes]